MELFRSLTGSLRRKTSTRSTQSVISTFSQQSTTTTTSSTRSNPQAGNTKITMAAVAEFSEVQFSQEKEILIMASLKAPIFEKNPEDKRAPIDICCVIDRSGSMAGEKLDLVKQAMKFVVDNLEAEDTLCIVTYDTSLDTPLPFITTNKGGKEKALKAIEAIQAGSSTDLCGGLIRGMENVSKRSKKHDISSILLFTDGLANHGVTNVTEITRLMEKNTSPGCSVFTFGFGTDHDEKMLRTIAEAGSGMYYFVADVEKIPISFADCLGGLQSIVAQNLNLTLRGDKTQVQILKSLSAKYKITQGSLPGHSITLELGDLYSEEERDPVFLVKVCKLESELPEGEEQVLATFVLSYFNVLTTESETVEANLVIKRPAKVDKNLKPDTNLDRQRNRIQVAEAMENSRKKADEGKLEEAKALLQKTKDSVQNSTSGNDDFSLKLASQLDECIGDMKSREYYLAEGAKKISRKEQSHWNQRSNKLEEVETSFYETSAKMSSKKKAAAFF